MFHRGLSTPSVQYVQLSGSVCSSHTEETNLSPFLLCDPSYLSFVFINCMVSTPLLLFLPWLHSARPLPITPDCLCVRGRSIDLVRDCWKCFNSCPQTNTHTHTYICRHMHISLHQDQEINHSGKGEQEGGDVKCAALNVLTGSLVTHAK